MKKVAIITITGLGNYGNRLQNYALQQVLEKTCGCKCETLINKSSRLKGYIKQIIMPSRGGLSKREQIFKLFNDYYIHFSDITINNVVSNKRLLDYDCLVCGSDQIWNSDYPENDRANFGYFFKQLKAISYAASFGTSKVTSSKQKNYAKYLKQLKAISVRETKGAEIAESLSGRKDIQVHIDPTLLLSAEEWKQIEKKPEMYSGGRYILKYFLGERNEELNQELESYAKSNDLQIIDIISPNSPYYNIGPSEFVYLEHNAELIVTDSFHSSAFAMLFEKQFIVANRRDAKLSGMGSRIDTLLEKFGMSERRYSIGSIYLLASKLIDYSHMKDVLAVEREKSFEYIRDNV